MDTEFYKEAFNASNVATLAVDESGCILAVNPAFLKLFNETKLAQDNFIGKDLFSHPVLASNNLCEIYQQLLSGDVKTITNVVIPQSENVNDTYFDIHVRSCTRTSGTATDTYLVIHNDVTARVAANESAAQARDLLDEIQEVTSFGWWDLNIPSQAAAWSKQLFYLLGYDPGVDEAKAENFLARIHPEDREKAIAALEKPFEDHGPYASEFRLLLPDGKIRHVSEHGRVILDKQGNGLHYLGTTLDMTDRVEAEQKLRDSELELRKILENMQDTYYRTDRNGCLVRVSPSVNQLLGYKPDEVLGMEVTDFYFDPNESERLFHELQDNNGSVLDFEVPLKHKDNSIVWGSTNAQTILDEGGNIIGVEGTIRNITDFIQSQENIKFLAHHDVLTSLPNRVLFMERLEHAVVRAKRHGLRLTVMFLDLDMFKVVNDTLGHQFGDILLRNVSKRLLNCIREEDTFARLGGDEFAILIEESMSISDISTLANKLLDTVAKPFYIQDREMHISTSIGISSFPHDGERTDLLLSKADAAMYKAKEIGRNNYTFYSSEISERAGDRLKIENALRCALDRNEFCIYYQPQMNLDNGKIEGVEALLRWQNPEFGLVMPTKFIFLLEEIGLIYKVGEWVIQTACRQLKVWHDAGYHELTMSINLSSRQFNNASIVDVVHQAISINQLDPKLIDLEITESLLMRNIKIVDDTLEELSRLGVNIAIDDFGTGYSSLSYLKRFPINVLKIDRSFIKDIVFDDRHSDEMEIVKAIIAMGKILKMKTIAEGVENEEQKAFFTENGCDMIQGYWLSKPLRVDNMNDWLSEHC